MNGKKKLGYLTKEGNIIKNTFETKCFDNEIIFDQELEYEIKKIGHRIVVIKKENPINAYHQILIRKNVSDTQEEKLKMNFLNSKINEKKRNFLQSFFDEINDFIYLFLLALTNGCVGVFVYLKRRKNNGILNNENLSDNNSAETNISTDNSTEFKINSIKEIEPPDHKAKKKCQICGCNFSVGAGFSRHFKSCQEKFKINLN